jgi:hypothetical protein
MGGLYTVVYMDNTTPSVAQRNALLTAVWNVILFGVSYLILDCYGRFFLAYVLGAVIMFFYPPAWVVLLIAVMIDSYIQTQKTNRGERRAHGNTTLTILGVTVMFAFAILTYVTLTLTSEKNRLAPSVTTCPVIYLGNPAAIAMCTQQAQELARKDAINRLIELQTSGQQ